MVSTCILYFQFVFGTIFIFFSIHEIRNIYTHHRQRWINSILSFLCIYSWVYVLFFFYFFLFFLFICVFRSRWNLYSPPGTIFCVKMLVWRSNRMKTIWGITGQVKAYVEINRENGRDGEWKLFLRLDINDRWQIYCYISDKNVNYFLILYVFKSDILGNAYSDLKACITIAISVSTPCGIDERKKREKKMKQKASMSVYWLIVLKAIQPISIYNSVCMGVHISCFNGILSNKLK